MDGSGNSTTSTGTVTVPHNRRNKLRESGGESRAASVIPERPKARPRAAVFSFNALVGADGGTVREQLGNGRLIALCSLAPFHEFFLETPRVKKILAMTAVALSFTACDGARTIAPELPQADITSAYSAPFVPTLYSAADANVRFAAAAPVDPTDLVVNGSFEINGGLNSTTFAGWQIFNSGNGKWYAQSGTNLMGFGVAAPTDGNFAAMVTQSGPGSHIMYQDVAIPTAGATLEFDVFVANRARSFVTPNFLLHTQGSIQQFRMDIVQTSASVTTLNASDVSVYRTNVGDPANSPYRRITYNMAAFAGQTVRLRFAQADNRGNFQLGIDHVTLIPNVPVNVAPVANAGADQTRECVAGGAVVNLDGSGSTDSDGTIASFAWAPGGATTALTMQSFLLGSHTATLTVTDNSGASDSDDVQITVVDTQDPTISMVLSPTTLWAPNHKMVKVASGISSSDGCYTSSSLTFGVTVTSNEPVNGLGDGDTAPDWTVVNNGNGTYDVFVRAERSGTGTGRVYTITATSVDGSGNSTTSTGTVTVPHSQKK